VTFFNKREDVIEIKLTQFGKDLISRGSFKPVFYRFFDDGVIYESACAQAVEAQNDSEGRINSSQRLRTIHVNTGIETRFDKESKEIEEKKAEIYKVLKRGQDPTDKEVLLRYALSSQNLGSQQTPNFKLRALGAPIKNTGPVERLMSTVVNPNGTEASSGVFLDIAQLTMTPTYTLVMDETERVLFESDPEPAELEDYAQDFAANEIKFFDGSKLLKTEENIVIDLQEFGVPYNRENFKIEIFEFIEGEDGIERAEKIEDNQIINELFDIRVDSSVNSSNYKNLGPSRRSKNFFSP